MACQRQLYLTLKHLGADRLATDAARVPRLAGIRNSKADRLVEALTPVGQPWPFDALSDEILPLSRVELQSLRVERAAKRGCNDRGVRPACRLDVQSLWELRLTEL
jgi:hypothetical protein